MNLKLAHAIVLPFFCLIQAGLGADQSRLLLGRWRSDTVPTGYWVIERFADGRYAEKAFQCYDYSKPSEIAFTWGRWKLKDHQYLSIIDGSTSGFVRKFSGKWKSTEISALAKTRFAFMSSDGHERSEAPYANKTNLVDLPIKAPPDLRGPNRTVTKPLLKSVPAWVLSAGTP